MPRRLGSALLVLALVGACEPTALTEIVVVVDTSIPDVTSFEVEATYPSGRTAIAAAELSDQPAPRTLVLVHRGGELGPLVLRVSARAGGEERAAVQRSVAFESGKSRELDVFLHADCAGLACDEGETCGNDGACRTIEVAPCELAREPCADGGVDPTDAGVPEDAARCPTLTVCGVAEMHLPGDRVAPIACEAPPPGAVVSVRDEATTLVAGAEGFLLERPGAHVASITVDGCVTERTFRVAGPVAHLAGIEIVGPLRALSARPGMAFVAGQGGAWAIDGLGWHDLYVGADPLLPRDLATAAAIGADVVLGTQTDAGSVVFASVPEPFTAATLAAYALPPGYRRASALAVRLDGAGPVVLATPAGATRLDGPTLTPIGPLVETWWITIGAVEDTQVGAAWAGRGQEAWNISVSGATVPFAGGVATTVPTVAGAVTEAALDDRTAEHRLWLCGPGGVSILQLADRAWIATGSLPPPSAMWPFPCADIAIGPDGHAWVVRGDGVLVRLSEGATEILVFGATQGLIGGPVVAHVAVATSPEHREVWLLDGAGREVIMYRADPWP